MNISSSVYLKESCFKFTVWIDQGVFITRKVVSSCGMYISWSVHHKESCLQLPYASIIKCSSQGKLFKVAVCIYHPMFISRKVVLKLRYGYIKACLSQGKLCKVAVCIYYGVFITRKVV